MIMYNGTVSILIQTAMIVSLNSDLECIQPVGGNPYQKNKKNTQEREGIWSVAKRCIHHYMYEVETVYNVFWSDSYVICFIML